MKLRNGAELWGRLQKAGLTQKSIGQFSLAEMLTLAAILADHVEGAPLGNLFKTFPYAKIIKISLLEQKGEKNERRQRNDPDANDR